MERIVGCSNGLSDCCTFTQSFTVERIVGLSDCGFSGKKVPSGLLDCRIVMIFFKLECCTDCRIVPKALKFAFFERIVGLF